jgi:hypothetical protein
MNVVSRYFPKPVFFTVKRDPGSSTSAKATGTICQPQKPALPNFCAFDIIFFSLVRIPLTREKLASWQVARIKGHFANQLASRKKSRVSC